MGVDAEWPELRTSLSRGQRAIADVREESSGVDQARLIEALFARVEQLEEDRRADRDEAAEEIRKARWLEVRTLFLEQTLAKITAEAEAVAGQIELCVEDIRQSDDRLGGRLSRLEREVLELREVDAETQNEVLELRSHRTNLAERLEQLTSNLLDASEHVETLTLRSRDELAEELDELAEETGEVRVIAEKANARADYAAASSDELQADLEREAARLRSEIRARASQASLDKVDDALARLRAQLADGGPGEVEPVDEKPAKKWHAHLPEFSGPKPRALPAAKRDKR